MLSGDRMVCLDCKQLARLIVRLLLFFLKIQQVAELISNDVKNLLA